MKVLKLDELPFSRIAREFVGAERVVSPGSLVVVGAGTPHKFVATGEGQLRMTSIQPSSSFSTEWLDE